VHEEQRPGAGSDERAERVGVRLERRSDVIEPTVHPHAQQGFDLGPVVIRGNEHFVAGSQPELSGTGPQRVTRARVEATARELEGERQVL
jgi:hypothetical protein